MGFTNPVDLWRVLHVCLCLGRSGVCDVGGEWVVSWARVWKGGVVLCMCESWVDSLCRWQVDGPEQRVPKQRRDLFVRDGLYICT